MTIASLHFDIVSLNRTGLGDYVTLFNYMKKQTSPKGIIFLQETHSIKLKHKIEGLWNKQFGSGKGSTKFSHGKSDARGVLIAFHKSLKYKIIEKHIDSNGRFVVLNSLIDSDPIILANYYTPCKEPDQLKILEELNRIFDQLQVKEDTQFIWGGYFNVVFDTVLDADGGSPKLKLKSVSKLLSIMLENDLCDIYRVRNPDTVRFTWHRKTSFKQRRLDLFLISDSLQENIELVDIIPSVESDHSVVKIKLCSSKENARGPSHWKLNNSLVNDRQFVDLLRAEIP